LPTYSARAKGYEQGLGAGHAVAGDEGVAGGIGGIAVDRDHWNTGGLGGANRYPGGGGTGRNVDERVDLASDQVLDLADLGRGVALGVDGDDLDALGLALGFDRLLDLVEEVGLQVGHGEADGQVLGQGLAGGGEGGGGEGGDQ
jgi:hypothetical protein